MNKPGALSDPVKCLLREGQGSRAVSQCCNCVVLFSRDESAKLIVIINQEGALAGLLDNLAVDNLAWDNNRQVCINGTVRASFQKGVK